MRSRKPMPHLRRLSAALGLVALLGPAAASAAVRLGLHMDFVLENGTTVRVFPAAEESDTFGLRPVWRNSPPAGPAFDDSSCDALEEEYNERIGVRATPPAQTQGANTIQALPKNR